MGGFAVTIASGWIGSVSVRDKFASFSLAVQRRKGGPTHWFNFVAFGKQRELVEEYVAKGRFLEVISHPEQRTWAENDKTLSQIVFIVREIIFPPKNTWPSQPAQLQGPPEEQVVEHVDQDLLEQPDLDDGENLD